MCDVWGRKISSNVNTTSDNYVRRTGDTIVGELSMNGNNINDLPTDVSKLVGSACACSYGIVTNLVSSTDACVVHKAGDTMTGNLMLSVASDNLRTFGCIDLSASKAFSIF